MEMHRDQYARVYLSAELVENAIYKIGAHSKGHAPYSHWMEMTAYILYRSTIINH